MEKNPQAYRHRSYRRSVLNHRFTFYNVTLGETDLFIGTNTDLSALARQSVLRLRSHVEAYIRLHPDFLQTLVPWPNDPFAPPVVQAMIAAAAVAGVGPMAAVAGAIAEEVGRELKKQSGSVVVENGGDLYLDSATSLRVGLYAGPSPFGDRLTLKIPAGEMPLGVCTSSGTVGHSLSLGCADAVCVKASSAALADAAATALGNRIHSLGDLRTTLAAGMKIPGVLGVLIVKGEHLGAVGNMEVSER